MSSLTILFVLILFLMSFGNIIGIYSVFGYDADYWEDIFYIICLNVTLWIGVASLCSLFEYDVIIHPCVFLLTSTIFLIVVGLLIWTISTMTSKLMQPIRDELITFVTLDGCVGVFLVISVGVVLVQQRRTKSDIEKLTRTTDDNRNNYISISRNETDVWTKTISKVQKSLK